MSQKIDTSRSSGLNLSHCVNCRWRTDVTGHSRTREFFVAVPVILNIPPRQTARVRLTVSEMPQLEQLGDRRSSFRLERDPIPPLYQWPFVRVSIKPNSYVYPNSTLVH